MDAVESKLKVVVWGGVGGVVGALAVGGLASSMPDLWASAVSGQAYWYLARAGGFIAYGLLWLAVVFGLLLTSKAARSWPGAARALAVHKFVTVLALIYAGLHALVLLGDCYLNFSLGQVVVPFAMGSYRTLWVGLGQLGFYGMLALALSDQVRRWIGFRSWRWLHYLSFGLYLLVTVHGFLAGTDSRTPFALSLYLGTGLITYALTVYRVLVTAHSQIKAGGVPA